MKKKIISLDELYERDGGMCKLGGHPMRREEATRDHIRPRFLGGGDEAWNIQLACGPCNLAKGHSFSRPKPSCRNMGPKRAQPKSFEDFLPEHGPVGSRNRSVL